MSTLRVGRMTGVKRDRSAKASVDAAEGSARASKVSRSEVSRNNGFRDSNADCSDDGEGVEDAPALETSDPDQMDQIQDRYSLRSHLDALRSKVNLEKGQIAQADNSCFKNILKTADGLRKHVEKPREQVKDAEVHLSISAELLNVARNAKMKGGVSCDEILGAILKKFGTRVGGSIGRMIDLEALGRAACGVVRVAPGLSTMVGPMDVERKPRQVRPRATQERPTQVTQPGRVVETDPDGPNTETEANIKTMFAILKKQKLEQKRVLFDHLIFNRHSFAQTVENVFALSFLVKDGRVEITNNANGKMEVAPRNAPKHKERSSGEGKNSQFIFRMDMKCWRIMKDHIPTGAEAMPHRGEMSSPDEEYCVRLSDGEGERDEPSARLRKSHRV